MKLQGGAMSRFMEEYIIGLQSKNLQGKEIGDFVINKR
jgi:hypothetical protein